MKVLCNECNRPFNVSIKKARNGDLEATYMRCKKCGAIYVIMVTDFDIRKRIASRESDKSVVKHRVDSLISLHREDIVNNRGGWVMK